MVEFLGTQVISHANDFKVGQLTNRSAAACLFAPLTGFRSREAMSVDPLVPPGLPDRPLRGAE